MKPGPLFLGRPLAISYVVALAASSAAWGQVPNLPATVQPGRAQQQLPQLQPEMAPAAADYDLLMLEAPANASSLYLVLHKVEFSGATVYSREQLQSYFKPYMGKRISLLQVYQVVGRITQAYRADGYMLAQVVVPPQVIDKGILRLRVLEGFVNSYDVVPTQVSGSSLDSKLPGLMGKNLTKHRPLTRSELERNVMLMNMLPGVTARAVLKPAAATPGGTDVLVLTSRERFGGYLQADNRGSRYLGPVQLGGGFTLNGVTDANDALSFQGTTTAQRSELHSVGGSYRRMLTPSGLTLNLNASQQGTRPGYRLKTFDVKGKDKSAGIGLSYPIVLSPKRTDTIYGGLSERDVDSSALNTVLSKDHIRSAQVGYTSIFQDESLGSQWPAVNMLNVEVKQGLNAFGASKRGSATSRPGASPSFTKVTASLSREQSLKRSNWTVYGEISGQYATKRLLTPEQFGLGGERLGSAYDSSELIGDSGYGVRGELRYLVIPKPNRLDVRTIQPYAFYDYGQAFTRNVSAGLKPHPSLASAGIGGRIEVGQGYSISLEAAKPISREVAALNGKDMRFFVKVRKSF